MKKSDKMRELLNSKRNKPNKPEVRVEPEVKNSEVRVEPEVSAIKVFIKKRIVRI